MGRIRLGCDSADLLNYLREKIGESGNDRSATQSDQTNALRKGQLMMEGCGALNFTDQFYALAGQFRPA